MNPWHLSPWHGFQHYQLRLKFFDQFSIRHKPLNTHIRHPNDVVNLSMERLVARTLLSSFTMASCFYASTDETILRFHFKFHWSNQPSINIRVIYVFALTQWWINQFLITLKHHRFLIFPIIILSAGADRGGHISNYDTRPAILGCRAIQLNHPPRPQCLSDICFINTENMKERCRSWLNFNSDRKDGRRVVN